MIGLRLLLGPDFTDGFRWVIVIQKSMHVPQLLTSGVRSCVSRLHPNRLTRQMMLVPFVLLRHRGAKASILIHMG
jgi:hypothetical protein